MKKQFLLNLSILISIFDLGLTIIFLIQSFLWFLAASLSVAAGATMSLGGSSVDIKSYTFIIFLILAIVSVVSCIVCITSARRIHQINSGELGNNKCEAYKVRIIVCGAFTFLSFILLAAYSLSTYLNDQKDKATVNQSIEQEMGPAIQQKIAFINEHCITAEYPGYYNCDAPIPFFLIPYGDNYAQSLRIRQAFDAFGILQYKPK